MKITTSGSRDRHRGPVITKIREKRNDQTTNRRDGRARGHHLHPAIPAHADTVCGHSPAKIVTIGRTNCPFALNLANAMMSGGGNSMTVYSPTTGESYQMYCRIEFHGRTTCRGGDDAVVDIY
jgi:hypothetical protein